jgi:hypothetical protein
MSRLPDRFDLWIRKAREQSESARQVDLILGALAALKEWHFLNIGTKEKPQAAKTEIEGDACLLVFSDLSRLEELIHVSGAVKHVAEGQPMPAITIPAEAALPWCAECQIGLLINPSEDSVMIPYDQLRDFHDEWKDRGAWRTGFWIPNMTSEDEDFWQEHGL